MTVQLSESIDIGVPIDEVFRWVADDGYVTLWDSRTISSYQGHTVRRRGAELTVHRMSRVANPPMMARIELQNHAESELIQFDLAPIINGTRLSVTSALQTPDAATERQILGNETLIRQAFRAELEQIKSLAEGGSPPAEIVPIENSIVRSFLGKMSDHGRQAWQNASSYERARALNAVTSGTNATNHNEATMATALADAILKKSTPAALAKTAALAAVDTTLLAYGLWTGSYIVAAIFAVILFLSLRSAMAVLRTRDVVSTGLAANVDFLDKSRQVEQAISRLWHESPQARATAIEELAAVDCSNSLNRRIEVALERIAAAGDPASSARAAAVLAARRGRIGELIQLQGRAA